MKYLERYTKVALIALTVVAIIEVIVHIADVEIRAVMKGESHLWCHLHTGYQKIEPSNIKGLHSNGKWLFKDGGSASSCEVIKVND